MAITQELGKCGNCPHRESLESHVCYQCAKKYITLIPENSCEVCHLPLEEEGCWNRICKYSIQYRFFTRNYSIGVRKGVLDYVIKRFKYDGKAGWAIILAKILVGYLDENRDSFKNFDTIIPSPARYQDENSSKKREHMTKIIESAASIESVYEWPFDIEEPPAIIHTKPTPSFSRLNLSERESAAISSVRGSLKIEIPHWTEGMNILVAEDIFTEGYNLREVARCLKLNGGAESVSQLSFARST